MGGVIETGAACHHPPMKGGKWASSPPAVRFMGPERAHRGELLKGERHLRGAMATKMAPRHSRACLREDEGLGAKTSEEYKIEEVRKGADPPHKPYTPPRRPGWAIEAIKRAAAERDRAKDHPPRSAKPAQAIATTKNLRGHHVQVELRRQRRTPSNKKPCRAICRVVKGRSHDRRLQVPSSSPVSE